jgi:MoaA/NifB/PqqE/SkfB family radical SAM enzyme
VSQLAATQLHAPCGDLYSGVLAAARRDRRLLSVHWELTHRCCASCAHCYLPFLPPGHPAAADELSTAEALRLIDELAALGALYLTFSGGEPLLRSDFFTLAEHARRRRFALRVFTNGLPVGPAAAARLAALHPLSVEISVYAADAPTHDALTGVCGSWQAATAALAHLHEAGVRTVCKTPLLAANADRLEALAALAAALGAAFRPDPILTVRAAGTPAERCAPLRLRMSDSQMQAALRALDRGRTPLPQGPLTCSVGRSGLLVDPYGTIMACTELRRALDSVRRRPIASIWADKDLWEPLALLDAQLWACAACADARWCARCHGGAANEGGDIRGPSPIHCRAAAIRRRIDRQQESDSHAA